VVLEGERFLDGRAVRFELEPRTDARGTLVPLEFDGLPFSPRRVFTVSGVPEGEVRGGHANVNGRQILLCLAGRVSVELRHGGEVANVELTGPSSGVLLAEGVWASQRYGPDALLLVLVSRAYDETEYSERPASGE
jgi:hypothetical protein